MLKLDTHAAIIIEKDDRKHVYYCPNNSNLGEIFDALTEMRAYIAQRIQEVNNSDIQKQETSKEV